MGPAPVSVFGTLLNLLVDDPSVGLALVTIQSQTVACNRRFRALTAPPAEQTSDDSVEPAHGAATQNPGVWEFIGPQAVATALDQQRPVLVRFIHEGRQVQCNVWPLPSSASGSPVCLVIATEGLAEPMEPARESPSAPDFAVLHPPIAELGPLASLTTRELEVLALIGKGMATREVAEALGRSPRTIERHCDTIHKKLGTSNRVQMARFAMQAGLTPETARLKRV